MSCFLSSFLQHALLTTAGERFGAVFLMPLTCWHYVVWKHRLISVILQTSWRAELKKFLDECYAFERLSNLLSLLYSSLGAGVIFKKIIFYFTKCCMFLIFVMLFIILFFWAQISIIWCQTQLQAESSAFTFLPRERSEPHRWHWPGFFVQTFGVMFGRNSGYCVIRVKQKFLRTRSTQPESLKT